MQGIETTNGFILSPATLLEHEAGHALQHATRPNTFEKATRKYDSVYDNPEERRNISTVEQRAARANKEIGPNQVTRENHDGLPVITVSPTSNKVNRKATYDYHKGREYGKGPYLSTKISYRKYKPK